ncbi:MAG: Uma2 family endonuclease [Caldilineaceae bacterium SB0664_bin_22]|nr:Uma2 family endonuclease [Caldilineaceae bacterium SB0664_bin_22]
MTPPRSELLDSPAVADSAACPRENAAPNPHAQTALPKEPRTPPTPWDWRDPAFPGETDSATANNARRARTVWRVLHPDEWEAELRSLSHYDPEYPYDEDHEYFPYWTTDPDYGKPNVRNLIYNMEGFVSPDLEIHNSLIDQIRETLYTPTGKDGHHRVKGTPDYHFTEELGREWMAITGTRKAKPLVKPDLVVFPEGRDNRSLKESRVIRTDPEHPVPEMVIEVVSPTSVVRDYEEKAFLYERLGILEYLIVDPGEPPTENHAGYDFQIVLHRMQNDGTYARVPGAGPEPNRTVRSEVLGALLRLTQADATGKLVFQWYDANLDIWRDHIGDGLRESAARGEARGEARGRLGVVLDLLEPVLPNKAAYDELQEVWASSGLPENVAAIIPAVLANPRQWRELLGLADKDGDEANGELPG